MQPTTHRRLTLLLGLLLLAGLAAPLAWPSPVQAATTLLDETFTGTTTNGPWIFGSGSSADAACLTAGGTLGCATASAGGQTGVLPDADGAGALRLTNRRVKQAGFAISQTALPAGRGLDIVFDYFAYGGSGADGLTFFLIDGSASPAIAGAFGGSLGYAQRTGVAGLVGGFIGIGLDEFGNYANGAEGRGAGCSAPLGQLGSRGLPGPAGPGYPDRITIRGAMGTVSNPADPTQGYCYITSAQTGSPLDTQAATRRADVVKRTVHIRLSTANVLSVEINGATVIPPIDLDTVPGQPPFPASFKIGFAGSTGDKTNYHEIQSLKITGLDPDLSISKTHNGEFTVGQQGVYTLQVHNEATGGPTLGPITVTDTLPDGLVYVSALGTDWVCSATGQIVTCNYGAGPVAPGTLLPPITLTVDVTSAVAHSVINVAEVQTPEDTNSSNNRAEDPTSVVREADLRINKTHATPDPLPGKDIVYTIVAANDGPNPVTGALVADAVPTTIGEVRWTCSPAPGARCGTAAGSGNTISLLVDLPVGATVTLIVRGTIDATVTGVLENTARVVPPPGTNDPTPDNNSSTDRVLITTPTAITLLRFAAEQQPDGVRVAWTTGAEVNTWGFHLWRSADGRRAGAVRITETPVLAQGRGSSGADYTWLDRAARPGLTYSYWIEEIETNGTIHEYGPAVTPQASREMHRVYLPLIVR